jgi:hypothetical protein
VIKWLLVGGGILIVVLAILFVITRRATVYINSGSGFVAMSSGEVSIHGTDYVGLRKVMGRFLKGDLYDMLWVSNVNDLYTGVTLGLENAEPRFSVFFNTLKDKEKVAVFRKAMSHFGYPLDEDSDGYNGGKREENRQTTFDYTLPADPDKMVAFTRAALSELQGDQGTTYFLTASLFADGPGASGSIHISRDNDPLSEVIPDSLIK